MNGTLSPLIHLIDDELGHATAWSGRDYSDRAM